MPFMGVKSFSVKINSFQFLQFPSARIPRLESVSSLSLSAFQLKEAKFSPSEIPIIKKEKKEFM